MRAGARARLPQDGGEQECRIDRLVVHDALVGAGQCTRQQHVRKMLFFLGQAFLGRRKQVTEQSVMAQLLPGLERMPAVEQLQHFFEHARRRHLQQQ
jgi:hypothetical protein